MGDIQDRPGPDSVRDALQRACETNTDSAWQGAIALLVDAVDKDVSRRIDQVQELSPQTAFGRYNKALCGAALVEALDELREKLYLSILANCSDTDPRVRVVSEQACADLAHPTLRNLV